MPNNKIYLGDGAYAEYDGYALILTTEDGVRVTHSIYLEPEVYKMLELFVHKLRTEIESDSKVL